MLGKKQTEIISKESNIICAVINIMMLFSNKTAFLFKWNWYTILY